MISALRGVIRTPAVELAPSRIGYTGVRTMSTLHDLRSIVREGDIEGYLCGSFMPSDAREAYYALRAFNIELATVRDACQDNAMTGRLRFAFWNDLVAAAYDPSGAPPSVFAAPLFQPIQRAVEKHGLTQRWMTRMIEARERDLDGEGPADMAALEAYGEQVQSSLLYLTLETVGVRDVQADHAASHIGVAAGLVNAIRGLPFHSARRQRYFPSSVLQQHGISDHDLFMFFHRAAMSKQTTASESGEGPAATVASAQSQEEVAQAIGNCVYDVASTAHAHLEHALQLQPSVPPQGVPALAFATPISMYLKQLETVGFDPLDPSLHSKGYLSLQWALTKHAFKGTFM